ncbi:P-loop containing nucleoside triphosphate hydrolase protein [Hypoxylon fragiforme]|uniref:P-loop containing nucleoside triphosphate hydrolase protein n=1 Tax=Hypoxylon fragiforme TaxID=63214 RepID=UPI0020C6D088|nr:P-loop containing nucleoside triphosphate hydrolase protein [Hypoxylon fragiforme]KAI2614794.1 P-loop containing nucleoside triphosphate hydrolase protein [Hypoxylon fragiforme]
MSHPYQPGLLTAQEARRLPDSTHRLLQLLRIFLPRKFDFDLTHLPTIFTLFSFFAGTLGLISRSRAWPYKWAQELFTVSISVPMNDELYQQVLDWMTTNVLERRPNRPLTAQTKPSRKFTVGGGDRDGGHDHDHDLQQIKNKFAIDYLSASGPVWFMHNWRPFAIETPTTKDDSFYSRRARSRWGDSSDCARDVLAITTLGRSQAPIKRLLETCRAASERHAQPTVTIRGFDRVNYHSYSHYASSAWEIKAHKVVRQLDSIHLDAGVKRGLVADIEQYLDPRTRRYYNARDIPYRRGYLLHGPPGTGKTSLSLALASRFGLDLYIVDLAAIPNDDVLDFLFRELPSPALVLMEDIDAVGLRKRAESKSRSSSSGDRTSAKKSCACTLAGVLNALDGVASSEGRVLLITTNKPEKLDEALLRPGRVDRKIYLGHINQRGAADMFRRMFEETPGEGERERDGEGESQDVESGREKGGRGKGGTDLVALGLQFSAQIPEETFTPAQIQEYLIQHQGSATEAVEQATGWVAEEVRKAEEIRMKEEEELRKAEMKRRKARLSDSGVTDLSDTTRSSTTCSD